jgi:hypothetical protein
MSEMFPFHRLSAFLSNLNFCEITRALPWHCIDHMFCTTSKKPGLRGLNNFQSETLLPWAP